MCPGLHKRDITVYTASTDVSTPSDTNRLTVLLERLNDILELLHVGREVSTVSRAVRWIRVSELGKALTSRTAESSSTLACRPSKMDGSIMPDGAAILYV